MRLVIITGVSRGLGRGLLDLFKQTSDHVLGIARSVKTETKGNVTTVSLDLSTNFDVSKDIPWKKLPDVDEVLFINNAAIIKPVAAIRDLTIKDIEKVYAVNVFAGVMIAKHLVQNFKKVHIVHIGTGAAFTPIAHWSLYCSTKAAIEMFFKVLEKEEKINLDIVDPGVMDTEMQDSVRSAEFPDKEYFQDLQAKDHLKDPADVAAFICEGYNLL